MTLNYPASDTAPTTFGGQPRDALNTSYSAAETAAYDEPIDENTVPIYARKPAKRAGIPKAALIALPVVLAMGVGAWALTAGNSSRDADTPAAAEDTSGLTTSRLDVTQPVSPEVAAPAVTEAVPAAATPAPAPVLRPAATPAPAARVARASTPAPSARRAAAPARRAAPATAAVVPATPQPYNAANSGALTTVITEPTAAPAVIAPTPVAPVEAPSPVTPPATTTPPGGQA